MKPAIWRIFQNGRWSYADQPSTRHQDRPAWQPLYASADTDAGREVLVAWMIRKGFATGHGDTIEDLLQELELGIAESWTRALINGVECERDQIVKLLTDDGWLMAARMVDARGHKFNKAEGRG